MNTVLCISGVCKRWNRAALACPSLWQYVAFSTASRSSMGRASTFLKRSGESPLFLYASGVHSRSSGASFPISATARHLFQLISTETYRLYACHLVSPPLELRMVLINPAPNLRHLFIRGDGKDYCRAITFQNTPRIETLSLAGCGMRSLNLLESLTTLDIGNYSFSGRLSLRRLLQALEATPRLRHLTLRRFFNFSAPVYFHQCVPMTQLRTIGLEFCDTVFILSHLALPPAVSVVINHDRFLPTDTIVSCFPPSSNRGSFLPGSRHIDIELFSGHPEYSLFVDARSGSRVSLRARVHHFMREDAWLLRSLEALPSSPLFSSVHSLTIRTDVRHIPWSGLLFQLARLSHLDVLCSDWAPLFNGLMAKHLDGVQRTRSGITTLSLGMDPQFNNFDHSHLRACVCRLIRADPPLERISLMTQTWEQMKREDPFWETLVHSVGMLPLNH